MDIFERVRSWMETDQDTDFNEIYRYLAFRARESFRDYQPTKVRGSKFPRRLQQWIESASNEEDQRGLMLLASELCFLGQSEFDVLHQTAFNEKVVQWLIDVKHINLDAPDIDDQLASAVGRTWFCELTDSGHVGDFCRLNGITGQVVRPDLLLLTAVNADSVSLLEFMKEHGYDQFVVIEDFVGSGDQMKGELGGDGPIDKIAKLPGAPPILLAPLVICPKGFEIGENLARTYNHITFSPVLTLTKDMFIPADPKDADPESKLERFRPLVSKLPPDSAFPGLRSGLRTKGYSPRQIRKFITGYRHGHKGVGGVIVLWTNCPDNTIMLVHHRSENWSPLFPRSSRL